MYAIAVSIASALAASLLWGTRALAVTPFSFAPHTGVTAGSLQTSAPVQITAIGGSTSIALSGGHFADFCIASSANCGACDVRGFARDAATIADNQYVCVRQVAPFGTPSDARATISIGDANGQFVVSTGAGLARGAVACTPDVDANGVIDALTDGLIIIRAMFGLTGAAATNNAIGLGAQRSSWEPIRQYLNANCGTNFGP